MRYNMKARVVMLLRNPISRAYSHWRMQRSRRVERLGFSQAIRDAGRRRMEGDVVAWRLFSYVERGYYSWQVRRLLECIHRPQVLFLKTEDLWLRPERSVFAIFHLCQMSFVAPEIKAEYIGLGSDRANGPSSDDREYLLNLYRDDIALTAHLSGENLTDWLRVDYEEPMRKM